MNSSAIEKGRTIRGPAVRIGIYCMVSYVGLLTMLLFFENWLVFHPTTAAQHWAPAPTGAGIEDIEFTSADGTRLHAWWCPAKNSDLALLYCHGNAGNLSHRGGTILRLRDFLQTSVLIIDYPGYGKSDGSPSEQGCFDAAEAAYTLLTDQKKIAPKNILLYGSSLGGGVITEIASRKEHRALILVKTFTSMPDMADDLYWWLPAPKRLLMSNQFQSKERLKLCHRPIFIAHGAKDDLIPYAHGERLFAAAHEPKQFFAIPDARHNDPLPREFFEKLRDFLRVYAP